MWDLLAKEFTGSFAVVPFPVAVVRLTAAMALGAIIGLEREWRSKPAGLRTHMLVSVAACLFVLVGQELSAMTFGDSGEQRQDPLRMIEAVTAGVAFLAAGLIFRSEGAIRNVTTGASLWMAGAVGLACGAGNISLAALATVVVTVVVGALRVVSKALSD